MTKSSWPWAVILAGMIVTTSTLGALASSCGPYKPQNGPFVDRTLDLRPIPLFSAQVGSYTIKQYKGDVIVINNKDYATPQEVARVTIPTFKRADAAYPSRMSGRYLFYGDRNRFLFLDFHLSYNYSGLQAVYDPVQIDLMRREVHRLPETIKNPNLNNYAKYTPMEQYFTVSSTNGLAFSLWYWLGNLYDDRELYDGAALYRSDTGQIFAPKVRFRITTSKGGHPLANISAPYAQFLEIDKYGNQKSLILASQLPNGQLDIQPLS